MRTSQWHDLLRRKRKLVVLQYFVRVPIEQLDEIVARGEPDAPCPARRPENACSCTYALKIELRGIVVSENGKARSGLQLQLIVDSRCPTRKAIPDKKNVADLTMVCQRNVARIKNGRITAH